MPILFSSSLMDCSFISISTDLIMQLYDADGSRFSGAATEAATACCVIIFSARRMFSSLTIFCFSALDLTMKPSFVLTIMAVSSNLRLCHICAICTRLSSCVVLKLNTCLCCVLICVGCVYTVVGLVDCWVVVVVLCARLVCCFTSADDVHAELSDSELRGLPRPRFLGVLNSSSESEPMLRVGVGGNYHYWNSI